jgi:hypothetical protein
VLPGQAGPHPSGPIYGDWTRPSRSGAAPETDGDRAAVPPATTAIPERDTARGRQGATGLDDDVEDDDYYDDHEYDDDRYDDDYDELPDHRSAAVAGDARAPLTDPGTGPSTAVRGGRAADRAARQVVDEKRRKQLKAQGETMTARSYLAGDDLKEDRGPRRKILALVAVAVVALGVLGVYSFISPATQDASSGKPATSSSAAPATGIADATLPELSISAPAGPSAPADVKAPVTVLNETDVTGLAGRIAGALQGSGWETPSTAAYPGSDIAVTTVYYTDGDQTQQQAAQALVNQFPQIHGPAVRFFDVEGQPAPGLVVVAAGDWQP